jgi:hypothetical protein
MGLKVMKRASSTEVKDRKKGASLLSTMMVVALAAPLVMTSNGWPDNLDGTTTNKKISNYCTLSPSPDPPPEVLNSYSPATVDPESWENFYVEARDNDNLSDVDEVHFRIYENTLNYDSSDNKRNHYSFKWVRGFGFSEVGPGTGEHIDTGASSAGSDSATLDNWTFRIKTSAIAKPTNYNVWVKVVDNSDAQDNQEFANDFSVNTYISFSWDTSTVSFSGNPGDTDVGASENPVTVTVDANVDFNIQHKVSGAMENASTSSTIPTSNMYADANGSSPWDLTLSSTYDNLYSGIGWGESVTNNSYFFLDFPSPLEDLTFTNTYYLEVVEA